MSTVEITFKPSNSALLAQSDVTLLASDNCHTKSTEIEFDFIHVFYAMKQHLI